MVTGTDDGGGVHPPNGRGFDTLGRIRDVPRGHTLLFRFSPHRLS